MVKISVNLNAERAKTEATRQEYLDKMCVHTAHAKHALSLDKMLGEKKVMLDEKEQDLAWREVVLTEGTKTSDRRWPITIANRRGYRVF
jgi:hypothetical protein